MFALFSLFAFKNVVEKKLSQMILDKKLHGKCILIGLKESALLEKRHNSI